MIQYSLINRRFNDFEKVAEYTNEIYKSTDFKEFSSCVPNEDCTLMYSPEMIDKMVYVAVKIANYDFAYSYC